VKILVINAGSSSVKFTCFDRSALEVAAEGSIERIGLDGTQLHYRRPGADAVTRAVHVTDTAQAVDAAQQWLLDPGHGVLNDPDDIVAVGHRVVHGGEKLVDTVQVDDDVKQVIRECFELAPLHNPPNLDGIEACERVFPQARQVAVFDTAFHATIPGHAYLYGIPYQLYRGARIRRYGFHGISHKYVSREAARMIGRPPEELKIVTCHLGNGCSMTAVDGGKSVDTTMGFTPLEGLIMGTRCGDLDPAVVLYLMEHRHMSPQDVDNMLNRQSGLMGLAEIGSSDLRDIIQARNDGNRQAALAVDAFVYRIRKYIGAYMAALNGLDAVVFTAGIGENSPVIRRMVCQGWETANSMHIALDPEKNDHPSREPRSIHRPESRVRILVIPTNEEKEIAAQTARILDRTGER
jgi:acetate kinase